MSTDTELKRKLGSMLGASMLATTLSAVPIKLDPTNLSINGSYASAESGNSGSGESGDTDSGGNSGSGSGGETGENSGRGNSGEKSGSGNSGRSNAGTKGRGGFIRNLFFGNNRERNKKGRHNTSRSIPSRFGRVVRFRTSRRLTEVKYSDGWSEMIRNGRYQLLDPKGKIVISRRVRNSDRSRIKAVTKK